ncbi:MAG: hypothetical protein AAFU57_12190 [Bacteroidota bacterium]
MKKRILLLVLCHLALCSCEDILEVQDISNESVVLLAPAENTVVTDSVVNFVWNEILDVDIDAYRVQIATPSFESAAQIVLDSTLTLDSTFVGTRVSQKLSNRAYQWRVKAMNSAFETNFTVNDFTVDVPSN